MGAAALATPATAGPVYTRRQPEKTALFQVVQQHLLTFEQQWTDAADGRMLPSFVTDELHGFTACGILGRGFAHLYCEACGQHHVVAFSCKARAVCPSCLGRRMSEGAAELVDHVLPEVPIRQWVLTVPFPSPARWASKRKPVRIVLDPDDRPVSKGTLCSQDHGFNLHAATRVAVPRDSGTDSPPKTG